MGVMSATIFYNDAKKLQREAQCFGVRFDGQILPQGSVAVGFLKCEQETLDPPYLTDEQEPFWNQALKFAHAWLQDDYAALSTINEEEIL